MWGDYRTDCPPTNTKITMAYTNYQRNYYKKKYLIKELKGLLAVFILETLFIAFVFYTMTNV